MNTFLDDYPPFAPDFDLTDRRYTTWSQEEAQRYFDWFMGIKESRRVFVEQFLALDQRLAGEARILAINDVVSALPVEQMRGPSGMIPIAYSLGADIGLVLADAIEHSAGQERLWWQIVDDDEVAHVSYRLPALHGFMNNNDLDPVLIGKNMLGRVVRGKSAGLDTAYRHWMTLVEVGEP